MITIQMPVTPSQRRTGRVAAGFLAPLLLVVAWTLPAFAQGGRSIFDDDGPPPPTKTTPKPATPPTPPPPPRLSPRPDAPKPPPPTPEATPEAPEPTPPPVPSKVPVPTAAALAPAQALVWEAFEAEYAKTTAADKSGLARALLREVPANQTDAATLYVLLREARDLATAAGDAEAAAVAVRRIGEAFAVGDARAVKAQEAAAVLAAAKSAAEAAPAAKLPPALARRAAELVLLIAEEQRAAGYYAPAAQTAALADTAAKRSQDLGFAARVHARVAALQAMAAEAEPVRLALVKLKSAPDDPDANLTTGAFYALLLDRFDLGLPRLAKCGDAAIQAAAAKDVAAGDDAHALAAAADAWAEALKTRPPGSTQRDGIQRRALALYDRALESLQGLEAAPVRKRANDLRSTRLRRGGLVGEYFATRGLGLAGSAAITRIDPSIEFGWRGAPPDPAIPGENFSVRWTGYIKAAPGEYTLFVAHDDAVRVTINGQVGAADGPCRPRCSGTTRPPPARSPSPRWPI
jgi:hypothetical protein